MVVRTLAIGGIATPSFWLGIISILFVLDITNALFGTPWMPPIDYVPIWQDPIRNLSMAFLPAHHRRLPLRRGQHAHDPLGDARGAARGLHPHRPRQGPDREAHHQPPRAEERAAAGRHRDRHRVRLPDRRPRRDRAGVQPERHRPPVRAGGAEPGLHADPGAGDAGRRRLRVHQLVVDLLYAWLDPRIRFA